MHSKWMDRCVRFRYSCRMTAAYSFDRTYLHLESGTGHSMEPTVDYYYGRFQSWQLKHWFRYQVATYCRDWYAPRTICSHYAADCRLHCTRELRHGLRLHPMCPGTQRSYFGAGSSSILVRFVRCRMTQLQFLGG